MFVVLLGDGHVDEAVVTRIASEATLLTSWPRKASQRIAVPWNVPSWWISSCRDRAGKCEFAPWTATQDRPPQKSPPRPTSGSGTHLLSRGGTIVAESRATVSAGTPSGSQVDAFCTSPVAVVGSVASPAGCCAVVGAGVDADAVDVTVTVGVVGVVRGVSPQPAIRVPSAAASATVPAARRAMRVIDASTLSVM